MTSRENDLLMKCGYNDTSKSKQFMNRNVKIQSRRLYSPSLKNVSWIEDPQLILLILLIFHTFVCNCFFPAPPLLSLLKAKFTDKCMKN